MSLQIVKDSKNELLRRREINCIFNSMAGLIKRKDAVNMLAKSLNVDVEKVCLISLRTRTGTRDVSGIFYIYDNPEDAKKQLPKHIFLRLLSKEEREKLKKIKEKVPEKVKKGKES